MILTTGKIVFVTDPDESDCYIENLRTEYNTNLLQQYLQPIIDQYFIGDKSEIWLLSLIVQGEDLTFLLILNSFGKPT